MATLRQFSERLKAFDFKKEAMDLLKQESEEVLDLNRGQLKKGLTKNNRRIKQYRNYEYAKEKNRMNPEPGLGNPDYKLTGAYWRSFQLRVLNREQYEIFSTDSKAQKLEKRDPEAIIYGMTPESKAHFVKTKFRELNIRRAKERLGL